MSIRFRTSFAMLLAGMTLSSAALAAEISEKPCETDLCRSVRQSWTTVRQDASDATRWTKKKSVKGWDATKDATTKAAHWTGRESEKSWKATKAGTKDAAHDTAAWTRKAAHDVSQWGTDKTPDAAKTGQNQ